MSVSWTIFSYHKHLFVHTLQFDNMKHLSYIFVYSLIQIIELVCVNWHSSRCSRVVNLYCQISISINHNAFNSRSSRHKRFLLTHFLVFNCSYLFTFHLFIFFVYFCHYLYNISKISWRWAVNRNKSFYKCFWHDSVLRRSKISQ